MKGGYLTASIQNRLPSPRIFTCLGDPSGAISHCGTQPHAGTRGKWDAKPLLHDTVCLLGHDADMQIARGPLVEIEIVGWLADREAAIRAHMNALPVRRRPPSVTMFASVVAAVAFVATMVLSWPSA